MRAAVWIHAAAVAAALLAARPGAGDAQRAARICSTNIPVDLAGDLEKLDRQPPTTTPSGYHPELAVLTKYRWSRGAVLHVRFLGGHPIIQKKVENAANGWMREATTSIKFVFDQAPDAQIRVSFDPDSGSWSKIGTTAKSVKRSNATMNFGWLAADTEDEEYDRVVLHEFGHALGCIHEHQSPAADIKWKRNAVMAYYRDVNRWDEKTTARNIFFKYPAAAVANTKLDATSIMMYAFPKEFTEDGFETPWNTKLSDQDKEMIRTMYPPG